MSKYVLRNTILDLLLRIEEDSGYSNLLINHELKTRNIAPKDQGLLTEIVYGTIERKLTLDYYLEPFIDTSRKLEGWVRMILRMSVYQMEFLDRVPDYAIINEAVEIAKERGHEGIGSFVNGILRSVQREGVQDTAKITNNVKRLAVETSHPEWLVERWINDYGYQITKEMCTENLQQRPMSIRVQPLRMSREEVMTRLNEEGMETEPSELSSQGIIVRNGNVLQTDLFLDGYITIQDQSSMLAGELLDAKPGMTVLDACSAPGGKVTHIAEKMQNEGVIHAFDLHKNKIKLVNKKASELELSIIEAKQGDARNLQDTLEAESYDRIIIDAPCSGLGVIRSKPDVKYNKTVNDIARLANIQLEILESVAPLLKKSGLLLYSTCTVNIEENEAVVSEFLKQHTNFEIDPDFFGAIPDKIKEGSRVSENGLQLFPQTFQSDGFFLVRFIKR